MTGFAAALHILMARALVRLVLLSLCYSAITLCPSAGASFHPGRVVPGIRPIPEGAAIPAPQQPLRHPYIHHKPIPSQRISNGLTDLVEWDEHSLFVQGQRIFLW